MRDLSKTKERILALAREGGGTSIGRLIIRGICLFIASCLACYILRPPPRSWSAKTRLELMREIKREINAFVKENRRPPDSIEELVGFSGGGKHYRDNPFIGYVAMSNTVDGFLIQIWHRDCEWEYSDRIEAVLILGNLSQSVQSIEGTNESD